MATNNSAARLAASRQPAVYNGDIVTDVDFRRLSKRFSTVTPSQTI
jgi:hypothetical protein